MNIFSLLHPLSGILLMALCCSVSMAQPQDDIWISPPDTAIYPFPESARIQSADRIGERWLAVWGGTAPVADTGVRPVLWGQIVQGMNPQGEPFMVTGEIARPEWTVSVLALDDRFLVLWNDRRAVDSGVYMQRVGPGGSRIGEEIRWPALTELQSDSAVWTLRDSLGYAILWSEAMPGDQPDYFRQRLDSSGLPKGEHQLLRSADFDDERSYAGLPGVVIMPGDNPRFYHADARPDARPIPAGRLQDPYYLRADTSLAALHYDQDGSAYFEYYANIFDSLPVRRIPVPELQGRVPSVGAIAVDSAGNYRIFFLREQDGASDPPIFKTIDLYSFTLLGNGVFTAPIRVMSVASGREYISNSASYSTVYSDMMHRNGDDNVHRVTFKATFRAAGRENGFDIDRVDYQWYTLLFDGFGNLSELDSVRKGIMRRDVRSNPELLRTASPDSSIVRLRETNRTVALGVSLASLRQNYEQSNPGLALCNGEILAIWRQPEVRPRFHQAKLFSRPDSTVIPLEPFIPDEIVPYRGDRSYYENSASVISLAGSGFIRSASQSATQFKLGQWARYFYLRTYFPTERGWNRGAIGSDIIRLHTPVFDERYSYDPNTGTTLSCFTSGDYGPAGRRMILIGSDGTILGDTVHTHPSVGALIADGRGAYLNIHNGVARNSRGALLFSLDTSAATGNAIYQRALGQYFFRYYPVDSLGPGRRLASPAIQFEQYDYSGSKIGSVRIDAPGKYFDPAIVQRPADSSLHVIWPSDSGLWLTVIRPGFESALPPVRLSATTGRVKGAAGLFRNDSLFVVWEDYRNGASDIYGTVYDPGAPASVRSPVLPGDPDAGESRWFAAYPVPADHQVNIVPGVPADGILRLIVSDAAGRTVIDRMIGRGDASTIPVDVQGFHPGIYFFLLMRAGEVMGRGRFIVAR